MKLSPRTWGLFFLASLGLSTSAGAQAPDPGLPSTSGAQATKEGQIPELLPRPIRKGEASPSDGFLLSRSALETVSAMGADLRTCDELLAKERARLPEVVERIVERVPACPPTPLPPLPSPWPDRLLWGTGGALLGALATTGALLALTL